MVSMATAGQDKTLEGQPWRDRYCYPGHQSLVSMATVVRSKLSGGGA